MAKRHTKFVENIPHLTKLRLIKISAAMKSLNTDRGYGVSSAPYRNLNRHPNFVNEMSKLGFELQRIRDYYWIMVHPLLKLVVKRPVIIGEKPSRAVPTVILHKHGWTLFVQPLVDTSRMAVKKAADELHELSCEESGLEPHLGNIGLLDNRAVVFDW